MEQLTNLSRIRELCEKYGFSLSKGFGQNFIVNSGICPKICDAAAVDKSVNVLEIGPGFGTLTRELSARAAKVLAVEVDTRLLPVLEETLADCENVEIVNGDILKVDLKKIINERLDGECIVCANLPYYITSPVIMRLLEERLPIKTITAMVQKEAARRICAKTGTRESGAISYAVSYYSKPSVMFDVSPGSFYPPPRVVSSVIKLDLKEQLHFENNAEKEKQMFKLIKAAFSQRRKTLANAAAESMGCSKQEFTLALEKIGRGGKARAEELVLEDYFALTELIDKADN